MDNPETLATSSSRCITKTNKTTTQHRNLKTWATRTQPKKNWGWTKGLANEIFIFSNYVTIALMHQVFVSVIMLSRSLFKIKTLIKMWIKNK